MYLKKYWGNTLTLKTEDGAVLLPSSTWVPSGGENVKAVGTCQGWVQSLSSQTKDWHKIMVTLAI